MSLNGRHFSSVAAAAATAKKKEEATAKSGGGRGWFGSGEKTTDNYY